MVNASNMPAPLSVGDRVAVVAPAGPVDRERYEQGLAILQSRYEVVASRDTAEQHPHLKYLAGSDAQRASELQQAIDDPAIKAIFAVRGGFGCTRILNQLNTNALRTSAKWLVGYSDITALHARWQREGFQSLHAPMVQELSQLNDEQRTVYFEVLENAGPITLDDLQPCRLGCASGPLIGGNLAVLTSLLATPDFPDTRDCVLLLEDINESPYRVDRMLTQLQNAGALQNIAGVALGRFSDCAPEADGTTIETVLHEWLTTLACPVVSNLPVGHLGQNVPLRLGAIAEVIAETDRGQLRM